MKEFASRNKLLVVLVILVTLMVFYHFIYLSRERAAAIVLDYTTKIDWEGPYLRARAKAIKGSKQRFTYKGNEYITSTGKKI